MASRTVQFQRGRDGVGVALRLLFDAVCDRNALPGDSGLAEIRHAMTASVSWSCREKISCRSNRRTERAGHLWRSDQNDLRKTEYQHIPRSVSEAKDSVA